MKINVMWDVNSYMWCKYSDVSEQPAASSIYPDDEGP